jgi:glutathione S-transferase
MSRAHLYGVHYSPWTERARWALDIQRVPYRYHEHLPLLGEPLLRLRAKEKSGPRVSVPLFTADDGVFMDSYEIIERADRDAKRPLITDRVRTRELAALLERGLRATRARVTLRIQKDPEAQRESATAAVPAFLAGVFAPVAVVAARFIMKKHGVEVRSIEEEIATLREVLTEASQAVETARVPTPEDITAEDILVATALQGVSPVNAPHMALGAAVHRMWACKELQDEFAHLIAWRDRLYASARAFGRDPG